MKVRQCLYFFLSLTEWMFVCVCLFVFLSPVSIFLSVFLYFIDTSSSCAAQLCTSSHTLVLSVSLSVVFVYVHICLFLHLPSFLWLAEWRHTSFYLLSICICIFVFLCFCLLFCCTFVCLFAFYWHIKKRLNTQGRKVNKLSLFTSPAAHVYFFSTLNTVYM